MDEFDGDNLAILRTVTAFDGDLEYWYTLIQEWRPLQRYTVFDYPSDSTILVRKKELAKANPFDFLEGFTEALNKLGVDRISRRASHGTL